MNLVDTRVRRHSITLKPGAAWLLAGPMTLALWSWPAVPALAAGSVSSIVASGSADADAVNGGDASAPTASSNQGSSAGATQGQGLQEVTVTATRREEALSQVPESVTAITAGAVDTLGIKDFQDIARFTPGVKIDNQTNTIAIRGISASAGDATTGVYIDDTPIQMRALGFDPDQTLPKTFDVQRVEILRGPQGTLFGAGSEGGTVRYILTQPSVTQDSTYGRGELSFTQGGTANYELGVAHGGPIVDDVLGFRVSAWFRQDGGWIDNYNPYTGALDDSNTNRQGTLMLRAALLWQPSSSLQITPSFLYQDRKRHDRGTYWPIYSDPDSDKYGAGNITPQIEPDRYYLPMVKIQDDIGSMQLISNTSYYNRRDLSGYDGTAYTYSYWQTVLPGAPATPDYPPSSPYYPLIGVHGITVPPALDGYTQPARVTNWQQNWTEEVRLQSNDLSSPFTWTAGLYWETDSSFSSEELMIPSLAEETLVDETLFGAPPATALTAFGYPVYGAPFLPNGDSYFLHNWGHDEQFAGFGELSYTIGPVKLTVGGRAADSWFNFSTLTLEAFTPPVFGYQGRQSATPFTPKAGIEYHIDPNDMLYATYASGFRNGGTNAPIPGGTACNASEALVGQPTQTYKPDRVNSLEVGDKDSFLDQRIQIANSVYYIKWNGIQQSIYLVSCGLQFTNNVGYAVSKGADIQADFRLTPSLTLNATAGYNSSYFTQDAPGNVVMKGDAITGFAGALPTWTTTLGLQYNTALADHESFVRGDWEYNGTNNRLTPTMDVRSSQFNPYAFRLPANKFVSLRAGMHFGPWEIDAFCDNLLDSHDITGYGQSGIDETNFSPTNFANPPPAPLTSYYSFRPRTMGLTAIFSR